MSEQHNSKTEGRGDILARQERIAELAKQVRVEGWAEADGENWLRIIARSVAWEIAGYKPLDGNDWVNTATGIIQKMLEKLSRLLNEGGGDVLYETMREIEHYENHGLIPETVAWREAVDEAIKFIADEYRDPSYEPEGEWLPPKARRVHRKLCEALYTTPPSQSGGVREALEKITLALEQAQDCIRGEQPEDMSDEDAREDTISKIREAMFEVIPALRTLSAKPTANRSEK